MNRKLQYTSKGRGGHVIYSDNISAIQLEFEFGGGNCVAYIYIPSVKNWESETKRPLTEREEILQFIASRSTRDQVSNGYYKITDNYIELYKD